MKTRDQIVSEARRIRGEIHQIFIDANYWNTSVRKSHENPINPDPDGTLEKMARSIDVMLVKEGQPIIAEYLTAEQDWKPCVVMPPEESDPPRFLAILSNDVRHLVPPYNVRFAS